MYKFTGCEGGMINKYNPIFFFAFDEVAKQIIELMEERYDTHLELRNGKIVLINNILDYKKLENNEEVRSNTIIRLTQTFHNNRIYGLNTGSV